MGRSDYYKSGDWNAECDVCGQKYKASKLKLRWDGIRVCPKDFEFRHPQDFVRGIRDNPSTPFSRPEPPDVFAIFNWTQFPSDNLFPLDSLSKVVNYNRVASDNVTISDSTNLSTHYNKVASDTIISSDLTSFQFNGIRLIPDSVTMLDTTLTFNLVTGTQLNGSPLNSIPLG